MTTALIGSSGFLGANLLAQAHFDEKVDDAGRLRGSDLDLLVCDGAAAAKWKANREPGEDRAAVQALIGALGELTARKLVLISTVDAYPHPEGVDEDSPIDAAAASPYGRHRRELEEFCLSRFSATVLRLPVPFGPGLRKNVLFDLLNDHQVENVHPDGVFQYYGVAHLWRDLNMAVERGIGVLNLVGEPVPTRELALRCFGRELTRYPAAPPALYDVRSKHAPLWGGNPFGYLYPKERIFSEITAFIDHETAL